MISSSSDFFIASLRTSSRIRMRIVPRMNTTKDRIAKGVT